MEGGAGACGDHINIRPVVVQGGSGSVGLLKGLLIPACKFRCSKAFCPKQTSSSAALLLLFSCYCEPQHTLGKRTTSTGKFLNRLCAKASAQTILYTPETYLRMQCTYSQSALAVKAHTSWVLCTTSFEFFLHSAATVLCLLYCSTRC